MNATFPCPHCGATYPAKPVLVGKVVRCTACKLPFRLGEDGIALKAEMPAPAVPQAAVTVPAPPAPAPPAPAPVPPPAPKADTDRLRKDQQVARDQMAASLKAAMGGALQAEAAKAEEPGAGSDANRRAKTAGSASGKRRGIGPVILTGDGERAAMEQRVFWAWVGAVVLGVVVLFWLFSLRSSARAALDVWCAPVPEGQARYPLRATTIRGRGWLHAGAPAAVPVAPFINLSDARIGDEVELPVAPLVAAAKALAGRTWDHGQQAWVAPVPAKGKTPPPLSGKELSKLLATADLDEQTQEIARALLEGVDAAGTPIWRDQLATGKVPDRLVWTVFMGRYGERLREDTPPVYRLAKGPYRGVLLRAEGGGWPEGWRVLLLMPVE